MNNLQRVWNRGLSRCAERPYLIPLFVLMIPLMPVMVPLFAYLEKKPVLKRQLGLGFRLVGFAYCGFAMAVAVSCLIAKAKGY